MTTLVWLAASSLVWGGVLWGAAIALQGGNDLSGRVRQWVWRGAAILLVMPWLAVPVVGALSLDLSGSMATPVTFGGGPAVLEAPATPLAAASVDMANLQAAVVVDRGIAIPWIEILAVAVVIGWLLRIAAAGRAMRRLGRIISESRPGEGAVLAIMARWSRTLGMRRTPELRMIAANTSPFSTGVSKPVVCLPEDIEQVMQAETLDLVVGHECIHVARGDGWRRPLERSIADIMWFNPFAWAIRRELDLARELACDEAVVSVSSQRRAYARTLRAVAGMAAALPASAPAASMSLSGGGRLLAIRMKRTLDTAARRPAKAAIVGAVMLAVAATPMAIAQAILIEAVQPPDVPAPPTPPAPPAPSTGALAVALKPPTPPTPPRAPHHIQVSQDGKVRIGFAARVVETSGDATKGYRVSLLQTSKNAAGETCGAKAAGLTSISVSKGQTVAKGAMIGERVSSGGLSIAMTCSDKTDSSGWPEASEAPQPPVPPAPPSPVDAVAPAALVAPVAQPLPPRPGTAPRVTPVGVTPTTPVTLATPRTAVTPVAPPSAVAPASPVPARSPTPAPAPVAQLTPASLATPSAFITRATPVTSAPQQAPAPPAPSKKQADRKTELVALDGTSVDSLQLRYGIDGAWVIDNQNILYRDTSDDYYLVTLKKTCKQLDIRRRSFNFFPSWSRRLLASNTYEVRHDSGLGGGGATGQPCDVARISRIGDARANTLRDAAQWRAW